MALADPDPIVAGALEAAVAAFAAARSARILLDSPGRLGADAVLQAQPISGARRASRKAQGPLADSARLVEESRDRWGALMRGLAADLDLPAELLVARVERAAARLAIRDALTLLRAASGSLAALEGSAAEIGSELARVEADLTRLAELVGTAAQTAHAPGGPSSG